MSYKPAFTITSTVLHLLQDISHELGFLSGAKLKPSPISLRKSNKIKTIQSSLAIEGNSLSIDQITAVLEGKRVLAPKKDLTEAENAINLYNDLGALKPLSIKSFLKAHKILMTSLTKDNGSWRAGGVGIMQGSKVAHVAPPASRVSILMDNLFEYIKKDKDDSWIIKACVFHYELEFIHPFSDGNGRIGRLWQQLLLMQSNDVFEYIPIETLIKSNQKEYYLVLAKCDRSGESTCFLEFMLAQILSTLQEYNGTVVSKINDPISRLDFAKEYFKERCFSRKEYLLLHKDISTATASRDLKYAALNAILKSNGAKNQTLYQF